MTHIDFKFNVHKALESILWLTQRGDGKADIYQIVKAMLWADIHHLNTYGRLITGDTYVAMKDGPVPSGTYDIIKRDGLTTAPLEDIPLERQGNTLRGLRDPKLDVFSKSDIEALEIGWERVRGKPFAEVKKEADDLDAYKKTWSERKSAADTIPLKLFVKDPSKLEVIAETASSIKI